MKPNQMQAIKSYLKDINIQYQSGLATEHSYRPALGDLLDELLGRKRKGVSITNEPAHLECGAPDFVVAHRNIPFGYLETKDVDEDLDDKKHQEQFKRYRDALGNLILTDYLEFRLCRGEDMICQATIAEIQGRQIKPLRSKFDEFAKLIKTFEEYEAQNIPSAEKLAYHMANKARLLANVISEALNKGQQEPADNSLEVQLKAFKDVLIRDIEPKDFADMYAQTIAYGLFTAQLYLQTQVDFDARLAEASPGTRQRQLAFSRQNVAQFIPKSNPFLRRFFHDIVGLDLDERIKWIVDDLVAMFNAANVAELMDAFGKPTQRVDPYLHFYETFLKEYDPAQRKGRGVYYTPEPVVQFIVRAVDDLLKNEFKLGDGLADTSKADKKDKQGKALHKVQILDPAAGTGAFLAEVVERIYYTEFVKKEQQGAWQSYVEQDLIPRLNGFEIMMAPYAVAHLKLAKTLEKDNYQLGDKRLCIFLTNALETLHADPSKQFAAWLAEESKQASEVKEDRPVMVVLGNPPYSVGARPNEEEFKLLEDYKREPGEKRNLDERSFGAINDDYVKFIRLGQYYIDRNDEGILAYISNNGFLNNVTFRGMRWRLLQSFDKIYILDLHGNARKRETAPDGSPDKNVFDIQQGVSINLFIKTGTKEKGTLARVFHVDLFGERESKYNFLKKRRLGEIEFQELEPQHPYYFFVPKDYRLKGKYEEGFAIKKLFLKKNMGVTTGQDRLTIHHEEKDALKVVGDICEMEKGEFYREYGDITSNAWDYEKTKQEIKQATKGHNFIKDILYRPFDLRKIIFNGRGGRFIARPCYAIMRHFLASTDNIGLISEKLQSSSDAWNKIFITDKISERHLLSDTGYCFPLYLYPDPDQHGLETDRKGREPNLDEEIVDQIAKQIDLQFTPEQQNNNKDTFAPIDLLDYIYAVLHSPSYCQTYSEYLRIDFARIPYPDDRDQFRALADLGAELRAFHLLKHKAVHQFITKYPKSGNHKIDQVKKKKNGDRKENRVYINKDQYFAGVPDAAWNCFIGSYQPAQKYLKDRKGRTLTSEERKHYQKMIVALNETESLRQKIDDLRSEW